MADAQEPKTPAPPEPPKPPEPPMEAPSLSPQARELLKFISDENKANRDYFDRLSKLLVGGISLLLTIAAILVGFFGWRTIQDIRNEARGATTDEITRMRQEIRSKIDQQFSTPVMQRTIHDAAVEQVKTAVRTGLNEELSTLRREADFARQQAASTRSDVDKYLMPRVLTDKQRAGLKSYLSSHAGFGELLRSSGAAFGDTLVIKYVLNDPEAEAYALQLRDAFRDGGWKSDTMGDTRQLAIGFSVLDCAVDAPRPYNPPPAQQRAQQDAQTVLCGALGLANAAVASMSSGGQSYSLYVYVGPRPLTIPGESGTQKMKMTPAPETSLRVNQR